LGGTKKILFFFLKKVDSENKIQKTTNKGPLTKSCLAKKAKEHQETRKKQKGEEDMETSRNKDETEISKVEFNDSEIEYISYGGEHHLPLIMNLVDEELSEPYSIFTYRYFVYLWPHLSFLVINL
jgi:peptide alpha-N-acetyltransferase